MTRLPHRESIPIQRLLFAKAVVCCLASRRVFMNEVFDMRPGSRTVADARAITFYQCSLGSISPSTLSLLALLHPGACFSRVPDTFGPFSLGCQNCLYIFATPRFQAIKLRNPFTFPYIKNIVKYQPFKNWPLVH